MNDKNLESYVYYHRSHCMIGSIIVYLVFVLLIGFLFFISFTHTNTSVEGNGRFGEGPYEGKIYVNRNRIYGLVDKKNGPMLNMGESADFIVTNQKGRSITIKTKVVRISKNAQYINKNYFYSLILKPRKSDNNPINLGMTGIIRIRIKRITYLKKIINGI